VNAFHSIPRSARDDSGTKSPKDVELAILRAAPYTPTWDLQRERAAAVAAGGASEALFLVEHTPVYTLGRRTDHAHLPSGEAALRALGAEVVPVDRGGDVTWHGPGQITGYPVLDLNHHGRDLHAYVWSIEQLLIDVAASYGIQAHRAEGMPGVWAGNAKLAAIGVKINRGWVTYHGFALNVCPDLAWFDHIVPCGLHGYGVTSLQQLLGRPITWDDAAERVAAAFEKRFGVRSCPISPAR
jgi:lipoyl(octanoyl) transferase